MKLQRLAPLGGVLLLAAASFGCSKLKARDQLNKGVGSFRNTQYQQAIDHFQKAIDFDPTLLNARLYLATSYFQLYVPSGDSPDNLKVGDQAIAAFEDVLKYDTNNVDALSSIATIYYYEKKFDKAKELQQRRLQIEPNNPEGYYWIGQLDWAICFPKTMQMRKDLNIANAKDPLHPDILPPIPDKDRAQLAEGNGPLIDEGIKALQKAIELKPDYVDAIAYLNLMYRQKADIEAEADARDADIAKANDLNAQANNLIKAQQEKSAKTTK
jgi:tetratricopeptide (TPR) repeat protein